MNEIIGTVAHGAAQAVLSVVVPAAATLLTGAIWRGFQYLGLKVEEKDRANMEKEIGIALGRGEAAALLLGERQVSRVLDTGTNYFIQRFPGRVVKIAKQAGAETSSDVQRAVSETLSARLTKDTPPVVQPPVLQPPVAVADPSQGAVSGLAVAGGTPTGINR